jgi:hypothetical protein
MLKLLKEERAMSEISQERLIIEMFGAIKVELREIRDLLEAYDEERLDAALAKRISKRNRIGATASSKLAGTQFAKERAAKAVAARQAKRALRRAEEEAAEAAAETKEVAARGT